MTDFFPEARNSYMGGMWVGFMDYLRCLEARKT